MIKLDKELQDELKNILNKVLKQDQAVRDRQLRLWKGLELYWRAIQNIYWNDTVKDYRPMDSTQQVAKDMDFYYADKIINIYRAHGESIIAALTQDVPQTVFIPDDADKQEDKETADTWTAIGELINKQSQSIMLLIRALYLMFNQGTIAAYIYSKPDEKNGTYKKPVYGRTSEFTDYYTCPNCGSDLEVSTRMSEEQNIDMMPCEYCQEMVSPLIETDEVKVPIIKDYKVEPKPRPCIEVYGMLNVRIPHYVREQKDCGYLVLETESHKAYAKDISNLDEIGSPSNDQTYDRWARIQQDFQWDNENDIVTWRRSWIRPWMFQEATTPEIRDQLKKMFPKGAYFLMMNDTFIEADNENMDECWVLSKSPISSHIHSEPIGLPAKAIQEIRSEIVVLQLQSIEYGIPETFADPAVLDFPSYRNTEAAPGQVFPIKQMPANRALQDAFTTLKTAAYPKESEDFKKSVDQDGQFLLGDYPSIYGGTLEGGSKTFAEYNASQARALQRLSTTWKILSDFWSNVIDKSVRIFVNDMKEDEKFVKKTGGNWVNVWIRKSSLIGKIGSVEPETTNSFPMSWGQKKDVIMKLLEYQRPEVMEVLAHPENSGVIAKYVGFPELFIPGEDSRNKQLNEIAEMVEAEPLVDETSPEALQAGQPVITPTIQIDPILDDHRVEFETCMAWLNGKYGQDAKVNNPSGFENVKAHARLHKQIYDLLMSQQEEKKNEQPANQNNE